MAQSSAPLRFKRATLSWTYSMLIISEILSLTCDGSPTEQRHIKLNIAVMRKGSVSLGKTNH